MEQTLEQLLQQGVVAHNAGNLEEAERLYCTVLEVDPGQPDANHNLGVMAVSVNKLELALPLFKTALNANGSVVQFWLSLIDALIKAKQFETAREFIDEASKAGLSEEDIDDLEAQFKQAAPLKSLESPSEEQINSLLECYNNGDHDDAEKLALTVTGQFPHHPFGWKVLGGVFTKTNRLSEAIVAFEKVTALTPQNADGHYNLGVALGALGRLEAALASYQLALVWEPESAGFHYNLGLTLQVLGRLEGAEACYRRSIELEPNNSDAHNNLGSALHKQFRSVEAEASFREAIALKPDSVEAYNNLGLALKELDRLEEAEASYRQAIALKSDFAAAHSNLAIVLQALSR